MTNTENQQAEYVNKRFKTYQEIEESVVKSIGENKSNLSKEYLESIRSLAIISGAIAAFSLTLIEYLNSMFITLGVSLLLIDVMIAFGHLMGLFDKTTRGILNHKSEYLAPIKKIKKNCVDFNRGYKDYNEWLEQEENFKNKEFDILVSRIEKASYEEDKLNYSGELIMTIFIIANSLVIFSLAEKSLIPKLSNLFL